MANEAPKQGTFCWNELMTRDVERATKFYTDLIGWKAEDSGMAGMNYTIFKTGDKGDGGMMAMPPDVAPEVPSHWMAYITVDDVDAASAKVTELGGKLLHGPQDIPTVGRFSVIQDPTGAVVGLIKLTS
jgi:predicted enzyme related to lactoylglutathione lyase